MAKISFFVVLFACCTVSGFAQSQHALAATGGSLTSSSLMIDYTVGEACATLVGDYTIGFQQPVFPVKIVEPRPVEISDLKVFEFITPNDDGKNDQFFIQGLEKYPDNEVVLMDRTGQIVFEQRNYQNDWQAKNLLAGPYFYVVKVPSLKAELKGGLVLTK